MKNITVSVDDEIYQAAREEAARRRKSLSALVREFFASLKTGEATPIGKGKRDPDLAALFAMADARPRQPGSVGPLNREELYHRGVSGH